MNLASRLGISDLKSILPCPCNIYVISCVVQSYLENNDFCIASIATWRFKSAKKGVSYIIISPSSLLLVNSKVRKEIIVIGPVPCAVYNKSDSIFEQN